MICLRDYIGGSSVRECYRHPLFEDKCVKVVKDKKDLPGLMREVRVSKLVAPYLEDYIVEYEDELVETDRGPGLVCGLVRNDCDGAVAPALAHYQEGGVELGFYARDAQRVMMQTMKGAVALLAEGGQHPEEEIDKVTTPGGVTIRGLNAMEHAGFTSAVIRGLKAGLKAAD